MTLAADQASALQDSQVSGHRILRHIEAAGDLTCWQTFGFVLHQETEGIETRRL